MKQLAVQAIQFLEQNGEVWRKLERNIVPESQKRKLEKEEEDQREFKFNLFDLRIEQLGDLEKA